tara:strand:- start:89749 stop:91257 length:1509 start_codon:yes stop_codon:yes gene_type:complete
MKTFQSLRIFFLLGVLVAFSTFVNGCEPKEENQEQLLNASVDPQFTEGAPYPAEDPPERDPKNDMDPIPVPDGPLVGDLSPLNDPVTIRALDIPNDSTPKNKEMRAPLFYKKYSELPNLTSVTSGCCPEISVAENGNTVIMTGNTWMALSKDAGTTFTYINPTTLFPNDDGPLCCDQVVEYLPEFDMFVWLLQYRNNASGDNKLRMAAQTTQQINSSNGTSWTYWDFSSNIFDAASTLDYNDLTFGNGSLWWTTQNGTGRIVVRIPQSQIAAKGTINFSYTGGTDALWSHLTHNATNTVYWAGHINNSQLRVYSMRDGDGFYSWRTVNINSWPNGTNSSVTPTQDWMLPFEDWKHYVFGNALQGESVWFAWLASANDRFPQPHVQMTKINTSSFTLDQQVQIWNPDFAFMDAFLSTNSRGELGMDVAFGGGPYHPSNAVGVWGDFVVYYPRLSTRTTNRWGDYNTSRRSGSNGVEWVAGGYTMETDAMGNNIMLPHYIRFGR